MDINGQPVTIDRDATVTALHYRVSIPDLVRDYSEGHRGGPGRFPGTLWHWVIPEADHTALVLLTAYDGSITVTTNHRLEG